MDRLIFLKRMEEQFPGDAEILYWQAQEYTEQGLYVEAIRQYSAALANCTDEKVKAALLLGLTEASTMLQQGKVNIEQQESDGKKYVEKSSANNRSLSVEEYMDKGDDEDEEEQYDDNEDSPPNRLVSRAGMIDHHGDVHINGGVASGTSPVTYASSPIGLQVLDGGITAKLQPTGNDSKKTTFSDVAGLKVLKKTIHLRIISPFQNQGLFSKFRKKAGGGVLLYGPPGCGKTFITKATAGECKATFIPIHITDILDKYIGVSEQNLKDIFDKARGLKPSIMFFDEIDTVGFNRSRSSSSMRGMIDTFLTEMEGIDTSTDQILVIGATNMPWDVDDALKRPGRFDRLIFVGPPDEEAREHMFRLKLEGRFVENIDTQALAKRTEFFSGADIENLCERVAEHVLGEILETGMERPMKMSDFDSLLQEVRPSTLEWLHKAKNYVKYANHSGVYNELEDYLRKHGRRI